MRAAVFYGGQDIRLEEVPSPRPAKGEVVVEVRAAGICGSDLHRYRGHDPWSTQAQAVAPRMFGHEIAGVVAEIGPHVEGLRIGQKVAIEPMQLAGCGECPACRRGDRNLCTARGSAGGRRPSAGFAELDVAASEHVHPVGQDLAFEVAALADVYGCAIHALHRLPVTAAETVVIVGTGAVALALGQAVRLAGARCLMVGRRQQALQAAARLQAADELIDNSRVEVSAAVQSLTNGDGAGIAFEVVGGTDSQTLRQAIDAVSPGGKVGILGAFEGDLRVPYLAANRKEIDLRWCNWYSTWKGRREFGIALDWLGQGRFDAQPMITHRFPLSKIQSAFHAANSKAESQAIKVIVQPNAAGEQIPRKAEVSHE